MSEKLDNQMRMDMARQIAHAASCLDWTKDNESSEAMVHIETLHAIALRLAGDRACEIYSNE